MKLLFGLGLPELLLIVLVVLLLFGAKKIPELMRSMGSGVKNFKDGMKGIDTPEQTEQKKDDTQQQNTSDITK